MATDQYAVAVLLYRLFTGRLPQDFAPEQDRLLRQVTDLPPLPFSQRGVRPWPAVEALLRRALAKEPAERFESMDEMHAAISTVAISEEPTQALDHARVTTAKPVDTAVDTTVDTTVVSKALAKYGLASPLLRNGLATAPRVSLWTGSTGVAWFLYRAATVRGDGELLALADSWIERGEKLWSHQQGAFHNAARGITSERVGEATPFHTRGGLHAVGALIALSRGDGKNLSHHLTSFLEATGSSSSLDLTLGTSGRLLTATALFEALSRHSVAATEASRLRSLLERVGGELWNAVGSTASLAHCPRLPHLAMAHGWAAWEHPDTTPTLCCGRAGRALALAALYRYSGEIAWQERARALLSPPASPESVATLSTLPEADHGLFKGALGSALAAVELEDPEQAIMPLFGS